jgi:hypothetical protein
VSACASLFRVVQSVGLGTTIGEPQFGARLPASGG